MNKIIHMEKGSVIFPSYDIIDEYIVRKIIAACKSQFKWMYFIGLWIPFLPLIWFQIKSLFQVQTVIL